MKSPREAYLAFLECLGADTLKIAWIKNRTRFDSETVTSREAGDRYSFLARKNCEGHCIYCRPWHPSPQWGRYVLCDDLRHENVGSALAAGARCIVETSSGSIQAWFSLPARVDTQTLKNVALFLAAKWGGDLRAAANPTQFGRLPGFTNRKAKHAGSSKSKSGFPLALLLHAKKSTILQPQILIEATSGCSNAPISRAFRQKDGLDGLSHGLLVAGAGAFRIAGFRASHAAQPKAPRRHRLLPAHVRQGGSPYGPACSDSVRFWRVGLLKV